LPNRNKADNLHYNGVCSYPVDTGPPRQLAAEIESIIRNIFLAQLNPFSSMATVHICDPGNFLTAGKAKLRFAAEVDLQII